VWLAPATVYLALLSSTDLYLYLYIALQIRPYPVVLGLVSSLWSVIFIVVSLTLCKVVEKGVNKLGATVSAALLVLSLLAPALTKDLLYVATSYCLLHAVALALGRVSVSVTLLEYVESSRWGLYNNLVNSASLAIRGVILVLISYNYLTAESLIILALTASAIFVWFLPPVVLPVERTLFRISKRLDSLYRYAKLAAVLPEVLDGGLEPSEILRSTWDEGRELPSYRPLLGAFLVVTSSDALAVVLPLVISRHLGSTATVLIYGLSSLVSSLIILALSKAPLSGSVAPVAALARGVIIPALLTLSRAEVALLYLVVISALFNLFNAANYVIYVNSSGGLNTFLYGVLSELGSVVGSTLSGVLASYLGYEYVIVVAVAGHLIASALTLGHYKVIGKL
jgi:hypothetical protein